MKNLRELVETAEKLGNTRFSPANRRFFRSRTGTRVYPVPHGAVFTESTRVDHTDGSSVRRFTVLFLDARDGEVYNLSEFRQYGSRAGAKYRALIEQERLTKEQQDQ